MTYPKQNALWINVPVACRLSAAVRDEHDHQGVVQFHRLGRELLGVASTTSRISARAVWSAGPGTPSFADNGANIVGSALQAFNYFGSRGVKKYFTRSRVSILTNGTAVKSSSA
jgi:hypothetical protein